VSKGLPVALVNGFTAFGCAAGLVEILALSSIDRPRYPLAEVSIVLVVVGIAGAFATAKLANLRLGVVFLAAATIGLSAVNLCVLMWGTQIWGLQDYPLANDLVAGRNGLYASLLVMTLASWGGLLCLTLANAMLPADPTMNERNTLDQI